jgi:transcriptional regulator with PAS, ATPase and Fis domain
VKVRAWVEELPVAVTVCDARGIVLEMNDLSAKNFSKYGGRALVGKDLAGCHPGESRLKLARLLKSRRVNIYTLEKRGARKIVIQAPWYRRGKYGGYVELSVALPAEVPHFIRGG